MLPKEWDSINRLGLTQSRHIADALTEIGTIYVDLGEPSRALDSYLEAENGTSMTIQNEKIWE